MKKLQIFKNNQFGEIRVATGEDNKPLFVAKDVCDVLGYSNPSKAIKDHVDDDDRYNGSLDRGGYMLFINESGLYSLILRSKAIRDNVNEEDRIYRQLSDFQGVNESFPHI